MMRAMKQDQVLNRPTPSMFMRVLNIALWILQALLAALFFWHGQFMTFPPADMVAMINSSMGEGPRLVIGVAEMLAAVGLLLPGMTRILPILTSVTAVGLMIVMVGATVFHLLRGETSSAISTTVIFVLVTLVAVLRWRVVPIAARR